MTAGKSDKMDHSLGTSHLNPVPMGMTAKTRIERGDAYSAPEIFDLEITVQEILRGIAADKTLEEQGVQPAGPEKGFEFVLARLSVGYQRRGRGFGKSPCRLAAGQFAAVSTDGQTRYALPQGAAQPSPALIAKQFMPGDVHEGWLLLQVPEKERRPLLIFNREYEEGVYGIWGSVWFELHGSEG